MTVEELVNEISVNTQSSIHIAHKGLSIYFDPIDIQEERHDADIIFFTHGHYDHYSPDDYRKLTKEDTLFIAPESMHSDMKRDGLTNAVYMQPGEKISEKGLKIESVPAYNDTHKRKYGWLGYVISLEGVSLYNTGDSGVTLEAEKVKADIVMIAIGGSFTMDAHEAAALVNKIQPAVAIPIHYGSIVGNPHDGDVFEHEVNDHIQVVKKIHFA